MAKLDAQRRNAIPDDKFLGPGRTFPANDAVHARMAVSGATRSERAGNISQATADSIKSKARKILRLRRPSK